MEWTECVTLLMRNGMGIEQMKIMEQETEQIGNCHEPSWNNCICTERTNEIKQRMDT